MKNKNLSSYILGALSVIIFIPVIESLSEVICTMLEIPKGKLTLSVMDINEKICNKQVEDEPVNTNCIGFTVPSQNDEDDEEW